MTDLITRARDQWCCLEYVRETVHGEQVTGYYSCPPEVVSALLGVLLEASDTSYGPYGDVCCAICGSSEIEQSNYYAPTIVHEQGCALMLAKAAIAKALEAQK